MSTAGLARSKSVERYAACDVFDFQQHMSIDSSRPPDWSAGVLVLAVPAFVRPSLWECRIRREDIPVIAAIGSNAIQVAQPENVAITLSDIWTMNGLHSEYHCRSNIRPAQLLGSGSESNLLCQEYSIMRPLSSSVRSVVFSQFLKCS